MRTHTKPKRRTALHVESLEGKTLLSGANAVVHHAIHAAATPTALSATFSGNYYSTNIPFFNNGMRYGFVNSGQVGGVKASLYGGIGLTNTLTPGRIIGSFEVINRGGTMTIDVSAASTSTSTLPSSFTYKVIAGTGTDRTYRGATGTVTIATTQTNSMSFGPITFASGQSTIAFA
jgi:hypothetical protein